MKKILLSILTILAPIYVNGETQSLTCATGAPKKGYANIYRDINMVCGEKVPLEELNTTGGPDNLNELSNKGAHIGIVGLDVFKGSKNEDDAVPLLKGVMPLGNSFLHILVLRAGYNTGAERRCSGIVVAGKCVGGDWDPIQTKVIKTENDLKGLTVAAVGSAQMVARKLLNSTMKMNLNILEMANDEDARAELKAGKVQAVLSYTTYPSGPILALKQSDGFILARWESEVSGEYKTVKKNYRNIGSHGVTFLTSQIFLMARPVDPNGDMGQKITRLRACIIANLPKLKDGSEFGPNWVDVVDLSVPAPMSEWSGNLRTAKSN
jgi:hypothetical protein